MSRVNIFFPLQKHLVFFGGVKRKGVVAACSGYHPLPPQVFSPAELFGISPIDLELANQLSWHYSTGTLCSDASALRDLDFAERGIRPDRVKFIKHEEEGAVVDPRFSDWDWVTWHASHVFELVPDQSDSTLLEICQVCGAVVPRFTLESLSASEGLHYRSSVPVDNLFIGDAGGYNSVVVTQSFVDWHESRDWTEIGFVQLGTVMF